MPSKPETEPTLEELSSYVDNELGPGDQARIAEHIAGCAGCQERLAGLRQTAYAIRGLPMESPPRSFANVLPRRQQFRWAPVGWVGSAAVAVVLIGIGLTHLPTPGVTSSGGTAENLNVPANEHKSAEAGAAAPVVAPGASALDQRAASGAFQAQANNSTVVDPNNASRRLTLSTDASSYGAHGTMRVVVQLGGSPSTSTNSDDQGVTLTLVRNGVGVALKPVGVISYNGTPIFGGSYDLASLPLASPVAGDYRLIATWVMPDGSGRILQASVPVQLTGS